MDLAEEVRELRKTVGIMSDQLTRIGVGPKLMKISEVAEFMGVTEAVIYEWRRMGEGPPFLHITARTVRYDRDDVIEWARSHRVAK
jgi:predicted DNA-binding transcriptional regulator AlpA